MLVVAISIIRILLYVYYYDLGVIVGGIIANSLAVATDAAHLLTDLTSFLISLISIYIASRPATKRLNFGWYRAGMLKCINKSEI